MTTKGNRRGRAADLGFTGVHHRWTVERLSRTFVVRVVEPQVYKPATHAEVFRSALGQLLQPAPEILDPFQKGMDFGLPPPMPEPFDLLTFPEAFVRAEEVAEAMLLLRELRMTGLVHVGLRRDDATHLIPTEMLLPVVETLVTAGDVPDEDFRAFKAWATTQTGKPTRNFNLGCLFGFDAKGRMRVCLHPKVVRSKFESAPLREAHMEEARYLVMVTLQPTDRRFFSVTLQPLLCSDALDLPTDYGHAPPIPAVNENVSCLGTNPPDHVDIVSLATCTPQTQIPEPPGRKWHEQFRTAFVAAAGGGRCPRHQQAVFVLANFLTVDSARGGLSGTFVPKPLTDTRFGPAITLSAFGRSTTAKGANRWSSDAEARSGEWSTFGFLAGLDPGLQPDAAVRILEFDLQRLPRDNPAWTAQETLTRCRMQVGRWSADGRISFEEGKQGP